MRRVIIVIAVALFTTIICSASEIDKLRQQVAILQEQPQLQQSNRITITEPMTLIRNTEDYIYLNSLEIDRNIWDNATKHTDINGITWREIIDDGYIKVYAEGHVMPDDVHWYSPY